MMRALPSSLAVSVALLLAGLAAIAASAPGPSAPAAAPGTPAAPVSVIDIDGAITPITVRLVSAHGNPQVQVSDTGVGIQSEDLSRVFERFYRADKSRSRDFGGADLGLSIAKWIAEVHSGGIEARAEARGGSTFVITLPGAEGM